ncbi:MAG: NAD-dependent succinate-semialdehyde dehydrogenase [Campylobacteraceae bacterium]|nr:NAD-dependent succinate-semialdehyde dehydrogenase [Campylobacteraceae bacterium]
MKMYNDYGLYINNEWVKGDKGEFDVINPYDESVIGQAPIASTDQVTLCIDSSMNALKEWNEMHSWDRAAKILKIADNLKANEDDIARTISLETGKPLSQAKREVVLSIDQFIWFSEQTKRIYGKTIQSRNPNTSVKVEYSAIGTVAAFSSWNFPILLMARKLAPALAAGCPMILRSTDVAPLTGMKLVQACHDADLPKGLVSFLCGSARVLSPRIMNDPRVRKLSLTGSTEVGKKLIESSAITLKKVTMELGGHAPVIVHADANIKEAAILCAAVKFANAGQVCVSPTRFYIHESKMDEFCETMVLEVEKHVLGSGLDDKTTMGPLVHSRRRDEIEVFIKKVHEQGGTILTGGKRPEGFDKGFFFEPTVIRDLPNTSFLLCNEIFGPIALVQSFKTYDEVIKKANSTEYALASYTFTTSLKLANKTSNDLVSGMVGVNSFALAAAEVPFGGIQASGFGRESGEEGMYEYMNSKIITTQFA